ncbi:YhgE/Pip domain-containing protein [Oceanobacillus rekensis]|uniref:YhgE/Pip domain-containing protein n=1 Tax=Oceanobacillus rekensis TaxID=937927 RepID=UPI001592E446|nr:YhgE/Pip domain-containing protein [Oceanobacillus rekensis]
MRFRKIAIALMATLLVFPSFPLSAASNENTNEKKDEAATDDGAYSAKDEVIYGNLDASGAQQQMYIVNTFYVTKPGKFTDYGDYASVRNLTNLTEMEQTEDNAIHFEADEKEFYYQGNMENLPLPWDIKINYLLDGEEISPADLVGKDGHVEIQIKTTANNDVNPVFFENYLLQISLTLNPAIYDNIQAVDGIEANAGKNKQITFTIMPDQVEELVVEADVVNFEMEPIDIVATPSSMSFDGIDIGGMTGDMQSLSTAIAEVNDGVGQLNQGISDLNTGAATLSNGSTEYLNGISELNQSSNELVNGSTSIQSALQTISESMEGSSGSIDLSELEALPEVLQQIAGGLKESASGLDMLKENYSTAYSTFDDAMTAIPAYNISDADIQTLYESGANADVIDQLVETYTVAHEAKATYSAVKEAFGAVDGTLEQVTGAIREMAGNLETMATELSASIESMDTMDSITQLKEGLSSLATEYKSFHSGFVSYTDGVSELAGSYSELDGGIQELSDGTNSLRNGASELHSGTTELQESTSDLPGQIEAEADAMMKDYDKSGFEPVSFVSSKNKKVNTVQFVLQTEGIEIEETESTEEIQEEEKGFWDRLIDLF